MFSPCNNCRINGIVAIVWVWPGRLRDYERDSDFALSTALSLRREGNNKGKRVKGTYRGWGLNVKSGSLEGMDFNPRLAGIIDLPL